MKEEIVKALLTTLINDQAYLYAMIKEQSFDPDLLTPEMFEAWQDEWKTQTANIVNDILSGEIVEELDE